MLNWDLPLPQKVAGVCPCTLTPWSPYYQDRRKERQKVISSQMGNALLVRIEPGALGECLSQFPNRMVRFGARGSFPSSHSSPDWWRENKHRVHKIRTRH